MNAPSTLSKRLTDEHLETWRTQGYVVVENFVHPEVVDAAVAEIHERVPTWQQLTNEAENWPDAKPSMWLDFPYRQHTYNDLVLNPELIDFARRALRDDDIVLAHSESLIKYASDVDFDQAMHADYGNNTFVVPDPDDLDQIASITYLTDVTMDLGPTRVLTAEESGEYLGSRGASRDDAPGLYEREHAIVVPAGSIFLYSMQTLHRGSAITATEGMRHSLHIAYQRRSTTWGGWRSFVTAGNTGWMARLLTRLTPDQRSMIGFPVVGDPYWNARTVEAVGRRYPDMDMSPYA